MTKAAPAFVTRDQHEADQTKRSAYLAKLNAPPIGVHLWGSAPGLETVPCADERRWKVFRGVAVDQIVRRLLTRLQRAPALVEIRAHGAETDVLGEHELAPDDGFIPLATFLYGVTTAEIEEAHQDLILAKWRPPSLTPQPEQ